VLERLNFVRGAHEANTGVNLVRSTGKKAEHSRGIYGVRGLSESFPVDDHHRISAQDQATWRRRSGNVHSFLARSAARKFLGPFAWLHFFHDLAGLHIEIEAGITQKFPAPRRSGGKKETHAEKL
jgi:hypothetical protein